MSNYVSTAPARADRGSDPPRKQKKQRKNDLRIKTHLRFRLSAKSGSKGKPKTCKNLTTRSPNHLANALKENYGFLPKPWWQHLAEFTTHAARLGMWPDAVEVEADTFIPKAAASPHLDKQRPISVASFIYRSWGSACFRKLSSKVYRNFRQKHTS